jgi:hypothetical protein
MVRGSGTSAAASPAGRVGLGRSLGDASISALSSARKPKAVVQPRVPSAVEAGSTRYPACPSVPHVTRGTASTWGPRGQQRPATVRGAVPVRAPARRKEGGPHLAAGSLVRALRIPFRFVLSLSRACPLRHLALLSWPRAKARARFVYCYTGASCRADMLASCVAPRNTLVDKSGGGPCF